MAKSGAGAGNGGRAGNRGVGTSNGSRPGKKLESLKGTAEKRFNQSASQKVNKNRTTQHTASKDRKYVTVPSDGIAIPTAAKDFNKAKGKPRPLSKPALKLELTPPGGATARKAPPSTAEKIDASKIPPVLTRKEKLAKQFAKALQKKKSQSKENGHSR